MFIKKLIEYFKEIFVSIRDATVSYLQVFPYFFGKTEEYKEITEQYPDPVSSRTEDDMPARMRGLLYNDIEKCTGCSDCSKVCPVECISLDIEEGPNIENKWVSVFNIDVGQCVFCGLCVDVCEPKSLVHTKQFEAAAFQISDLVLRFGRGRVSKEQRKKWESIREKEQKDTGQLF